MHKLTIAQAVIDVMKENDIEVIWAGEPDICIEAYLRTNGRVQHPLERIKAVIDAVRKSKRFQQDGYIRACDSSGTREVLLPAFKITTEIEHQG